MVNKRHKKAIENTLSFDYYLDWTLLEWSSIIDDICDLKGWNEEEKTQGDWAILVMTEISEAFEEYRKNREPGEIYHSSDGKPEGMAIEYADALIRILHWFEYHDLDPRYFMIKKLRYNITRPHRHGGKRV